MTSLLQQSHSSVLDLCDEGVLLLWSPCDYCVSRQLHLKRNIALIKVALIKVLLYLKDRFFSLKMAPFTQGLFSKWSIFLFKNYSQVFYFYGALVTTVCQSSTAAASKEKYQGQLFTDHDPRNAQNFLLHFFFPGEPTKLACAVPKALLVRSPKRLTCTLNSSIKIPSY